MGNSASHSHIVVRPMVAADLYQSFFNAGSRQHGEIWLEQQDRSEAYVAIAEYDGIAVGRVALDFKLKADRGAAFLMAAHVEPEYQSRGIGTALFNHLEQVARQHGFGAMMLHVGKENPNARRLYERLGYLVCGEEVNRWSHRDGDRIIEHTEDCWLMRKDLPSSPAAS
ncbi:MAG TPA: GNAT family N-acetyltransferase [Anaerolineae bacterium]|jgi:ribosomal protein S18 acetylase RimI-like enzyme